MKTKNKINFLISAFGGMFLLIATPLITGAQVFSKEELREKCDNLSRKNAEKRS